MAAPQVNMRIPEAALARIDAQAERCGMNRSEYMLEAAMQRVECDEAASDDELRDDAPAPTQPEARPFAPTPRQVAARAAGKAAEAKTGVAVTSVSSRARAAMDRAGTVEWDLNAKRTPYQKGSAGAGKGRKGR